jgi:hypothetical protein
LLGKKRKTEVFLWQDRTVIIMIITIIIKFLFLLKVFVYGSSARQKGNLEISVS